MDVSTMRDAHGDEGEGEGEGEGAASSSSSSWGARVHRADLGSENTTSLGVSSHLKKVRTRKQCSNTRFVFERFSNVHTCVFFS